MLPFIWTCVSPPIQMPEASSRMVIFPAAPINCPWNASYSLSTLFCLRSH